MKNIVLCCAAGMSTSMLVQKMKDAAQKKGVDVTDPLGKKVAVIDMMDYGMMKGDAVLDKALKLLE